MLKDGCTGIEHRPGFGDVYKDVISVFALSGTYLDPVMEYSYTQYGGYSPRWYFFKKFSPQLTEKFLHFYDSAEVSYLIKQNKDIQVHMSDPEFVAESNINASIFKQGGRMVMGSHGEFQGIGAHFEMWSLQMGGLTNLEAIKIATINGAEGLGVEKDLGSIKEGKIADLLILDKNPLDNIHNTLSIKYVMKSGILYEGETLNTKWPVEKKLPEWRLELPNN